MKKIGILGSHGNGKTTLAFQLAAEIKTADPQKTVSILPEVARKCPFLVNENSSINSQRWIFHKQMLVEIEHSGDDVLVCDRTILDNLAYSQVLGYTYLVETYFTQALNWMKTYDELYFMRPDKPMSDDGFRSTNEKFRTDMDKILAFWVNAYEMPVTARTIV